MFAISDIDTGSFAELSLQISSSAPRFVVRPTTGGAFVAVTGGTLLANTWQHIAISVNAGSGRLFLDGVQVGSTTTFSALQTRVYVGVGGYGNGYGTTLNGYIDDLRITKGYARYTANFTPPGPLPLY